jgi:integrase
VKKKQSRKDSKGRVLYKGEYERVDGRYVYQYFDINGKRQSKYANDLPQLREYEKEICRDAYDGIDTHMGQTVTLNIAFDRYMKLKPDIKSTTRSNYMYMYNHFVRQTFGNRKLATIKYSDVKEFYYTFIQENVMKASTLDSIHTLLHPTFAMAVRDGYLRVNPTEGVMAEIKRSKIWDVPKRHALTEEQQCAFMNYMAKNKEYQHWYNLFAVLLGTGCRVGELIGLRWQDVDFEDNTIDINHNFVYYRRENGKCGWSVNTPKTKAGMRQIPMLDVVRKALDDEYKWQLEQGFSDYTIDGYTGFIFTNRFGTLFMSQTLNRAIQRISKAYNTDEILKARQEKRKAKLLPHFSCHHLRHTFCARFCENEVNMKLLQEVMGHSDIGTTMNIYAELSNEKKKETFRLLEGVIKVN